MDCFPKWQKPEWMGHLTAEKLQSMSHEELYNFLRVLLRKTKELPDCPHKKFLVKLGTICLAVQKLKMEHDTATDERKEEIEKEVHEKLDASLKILLKLMVLNKAQEYANEVVEIEEESDEDPWNQSQSLKPSIMIEDKKEKDDEKNKVGEYDPWAASY